MTVETTSFLSSAKITSNGSEKSAKFIRNHKNLIIFLLAIILLLFCVSASALQIWIFNRMNGMQGEIDQLRSNVADMKKNMGFDDDLFDDLNDFDKKYNHNEVKEGIDLDGRVSIDDGKIKFDDVGDEDEDSFENSDEAEDNYEAAHSGYGDTYDEEDDDQYDLDSLEDETQGETQKDDDDDNNIYNDMKKTRKARSIAGITDQGVPILEESYASRKNRSRGFADVYGTNVVLPNKDEKNPKLKLTWETNRRNVNGPRREHHERVINRHHATRHHHSFQDSKSRFAFAAAPVQHSFENYGRKFNETSTMANPPAPIQTRRSRVMHVEDKSKAFRQVVRKDQLAKLEEVRKAPEQWSSSSPQNNVNVRRRMMNPVRRNLELKNGRRTKITAVHYEADSSSLAMGRHHEYQGEEEYQGGNNKVKLSKNEYIHWQAAEWTNSHGMDRFFSMDSNGVLTVRDHGLFLIYAQVFYSDDHDVNGYVIELNNRVHYQCTTMTHTTSRVTKINSCYTSGLIHLQNGDKIQLRDIGNHRSVMLEPSKSFFGLIKINLLPTAAAAAASESSEVESFNAEK